MTLPPHLELVKQWREWGGHIAESGWGAWRIQSFYGVSARRARTLREWATHGVPEKYREQVDGFSPSIAGSLDEPEIIRPRSDPPPNGGGRTAGAGGKDEFITEAIGPSILVIPDAHAMPNQDLRRFEWLGRAVVDLHPDAVVCLGDWADMESLNRFDKPGSRAFEGRRYTADSSADQEALRLVHRQIDGRWAGHLVFCEGNHEHRIAKAVDSSVTILDEVISLDDLDFARRGWSVFPFLEPFVCEGVAFSHYFASGVMGRAVGGVNMGRNLILKTLGSAVVGHSHILDYSRQARQDGSGRHYTGLSAGCYFEDDHAWAGPANRMYWRGFVVLRNVKDGDYDLETWEISRVRAKWGAK